MRRSDLEFIVEVVQKSGFKKPGAFIGTLCLVDADQPQSTVACYAVALVDGDTHTFFEPGVGGTVSQAEEDLLDIVRRRSRTLR